MPEEYICDIETTTLNPLSDDARVIMIGTKKLGGDIYIFYDESEERMLKRFWNWYDENKVLIGFNFNRFDKRYLIIRSLKYRLQVKNMTIIDLREILNFGNEYAKGTSEDFFKLLGLSEKPMNNSLVPERFKNGLIKEIKDYLSLELKNFEEMYYLVKRSNII